MIGRVLVGVVLTCVVWGFAWAGGYHYLKAEEFRVWLVKGKKMSIVDIQTPADFRKHHFRGAMETNAYPVKSAAELAALDRILPVLNASADPVVVVCPRGGGGAKAAYDHLHAKGITEGRLLILEGGMQGWPFRELVESVK